MATNIITWFCQFHYSVFMGHFVGRESSPSTSMQVASISS